jgi:hypothetical protein
VNLPRFNIKPGEYIMLCPTASVPELSKIGKTIGVPSWPTLNNTGETLSFRIFESLIFSVSFKTEWYKTAAKAEGGYSLEMIDPNNPCGEETNWSASNAAVGGTPGKVNSINAVNPDNLGPTIAQTVTSGADGVILYFNEKLTPELPLGNFTFEPNLTKKEVFLSADYKSIQVYFNESLQSNLKYTITAKGVRDCVGNVTENGTKSSFVLPVIAEKGGLLINEVLFNPRTGGSDFVEFYNPTQNYYNLKGWTTTNNPSGTDFKSITSDNLIIEPGKFLVLSPAPANIISNYLLGDASTYLTTTLPTMSDSEGRIAIKRADGLIIDDFSYSDDYHNRLLKDDEGVSLERVSLTAPTDDRNNWQSAASDVGYATPGRANSQARTVSGTLQSISIEPKVFVPGGNISFTTISYKDDNAGSFASFLIYDSRGQLVRTLTENQLLAANGFLTWDGTNNEGSKVNVGIYILVVELFNSSGIVEVLKETVVVGGSF